MQNKNNKILIPKGVCHSFNLHKWYFRTFHSKALIAKTCSRCGMNGVEYANRKKTVI